MKNKFKFKVGDKVKSAPDSSDVLGMKATWFAVIHEIKGENDSGGCYETLGTWTPLQDEKGNVSNFWAGRTAEKPTLRQLWGSHLVLIKEDN